MTTKYGDQATRDQKAKERQAVLARQTVPYCIAPGESFAAPRALLVAGDAILMSDLADGGAVSPVGRMRDLIDRQVVLAATEEQIRAANCPTDAKFRVAPKRAITTLARGILGPGEQVIEGTDVPLPDLRRLVERGVLVENTELAL